MPCDRQEKTGYLPTYCYTIKYLLLLFASHLIFSTASVTLITRRELQI